MLRKTQFSSLPMLSAALIAVAIATDATAARAAEIDLSRAVVVAPDGLAGPENQAVRVLVDEVRKRSRVGWDVVIRWPSAVVPVIAVGPARLLDSFPAEL